MASALRLCPPHVSAQARAALRPGEGMVLAFDSAFAPCGCVTWVFSEVPCTVAGWRERFERYELRCLACGTEWSRAVRRRGAGCCSEGLVLDATHPEERAARAERARRRGRVTAPKRIRRAQHPPIAEICRRLAELHAKLATCDHRSGAHPDQGPAFLVGWAESAIASLLDDLGVKVEQPRWIERALGCASSAPEPEEPAA